MPGTRRVRLGHRASSAGPRQPHLRWQAAAERQTGRGSAPELTAAHGGTLTATSPPGGGAAFTLTLPAP